MRLFCILLISVFFCLFLGAQSIGPYVDKTGGALTELQEVVSFGERGFVTVVVDRPQSPAKVVLVLFDLEENPVAEKSIVLSEEGLPAQVEAAFRWGDHLTLLTSLYYPGPQRNHLLLRRFSLPGLEEVDARLIQEAYSPAELRIPFGYSLSPDSTRLLCYGWSYSLPEDPARLTLRVYDRNLDLQWDRNYVLPYRNEIFYLYGGLLTSSDHVYLLAEAYQGNPSRYSTINYQKIKQVILYAGSDLGRPREYVIQPGKLILSNVRFARHPDGPVVGAGFYRRRGRSTNDGIISIRVDGAADRLDHNLLPVNKDSYQAAAEVPGAGPVDGANRWGFRDYTVDHLFVSGDTLILVGEQIIDRSGSIVPFEFTDILVARIREGRYLDWMVRLAKRQSGYFEDLSKFSYNAFNLEGRTMLLYNNLKSSYSRPSGNTVLGEVDSRGSLRLHDITGLLRQRQSMTPYPAKSWNLNREKLLLFGTQSQGNAQQVQAYLLLFPWQALVQQEPMNRGTDEQRNR